jgi:hypothetical protein
LVTPPRVALAIVVLMATLLASGNVLALTNPLAASPVPPTATQAPTPSPMAGLSLPANSVIELEMIDSVGSRLSKPGDFFKLRVAQAVKSGDRVLIPAGTPAVGQVVHAARSGGGGKAGELILAARYLDLPRGPIKLRSSFGATGRDRFKASAASSAVIGPFALLIKGTDVELPAGSPLSARLAQDTFFPTSP